MTKQLITALLLTLLVHPLDAWSTFGGGGSRNANSMLGKKSSALDVLTELNQSNQLAPHVVSGEGVAVVTGGNAGIGAVSCKTLALAGMKVVMCARNVQAAQAVVDSWPSHVRELVSVQELDLADLQSVEEAVKNILNKHPTIDVLLNNAGIMALPKKQTTKQDIELQFGTNHVGHHFLTRLLLPHLKQGGSGRVVTVASEAHRSASATSAEWQSSDYSGWREYSRSKLANVLFAKHLDAQLMSSDNHNNNNIDSVSLHPGVIGTNLWQYFPKFVRPLTKLFADKTVEQGAATSVYCCLAKNVEGAA